MTARGAELVEYYLERRARGNADDDSQTINMLAVIDHLTERAETAEADVERLRGTIEFNRGQVEKYRKAATRLEDELRRAQGHFAGDEILAAKRGAR